jgi:copper(I)-binding protein
MLRPILTYATRSLARCLLLAGATLVALSATVSAQAQPSGKRTYKLGALVIEQPWARATPAGAQVGGGYVKITNTGKEADRLVGGTLPMAGSVEVHEMSMTNGVMKMRQLGDGLEIKPGQSVELKPGGYHIMFMGLREGLKQGQTIKGTLSFAKAGSVEVEFAVAPIGAAAPSGGHMH